jgi:hypothetical protein
VDLDKQQWNLDNSVSDLKLRTSDSNLSYNFYLYPYLNMCGVKHND